MDENFAIPFDQTLRGGVERQIRLNAFRNFALNSDQKQIMSMTPSVRQTQTCTEC